MPNRDPIQRTTNMFATIISGAPPGLGRNDTGTGGLRHPANFGQGSPALQPPRFPSSSSALRANISGFAGSGDWRSRGWAYPGEAPGSAGRRDAGQCERDARAPPERCSGGGFSRLNAVDDGDLFRSRARRLGGDAVAEVEGADLADQGTKFLAEMGQGLAADSRSAWSGSVPRPRRAPRGGCGWPAGGCDPRRMGAASETLTSRAALGLAKLREEDGVGGDLAEIAGEAELIEGPDDPLGGIELPGLHAVAVIVLKLVVIIVVALAEGDEGHDPAIAGAAAAGVGPGAEGVAGGIDAEGAMLEADDRGRRRR